MEVFEIPLLSLQGIAMLAALAIVPAILVWLIARFAKQPKAGWIGLAVVVISLPVLAMVAWPMLTTTARLGDDGLVVDGGRYAVTVPYADIDVGGIVVDGAGELPRLGTRTHGIGLPGGSLGWFRAGERRVFAAYSGAAGSVYVPTRGNFDVLLSPDDAARLVDGLRARVAEATRAV